MISRKGDFVGPGAWPRGGVAKEVHKREWEMREGREGENWISNSGKREN